MCMQVCSECCVKQNNKKYLCFYKTDAYYLYVKRYRFHVTTSIQRYHLS